MLSRISGDEFLLLLNPIQSQQEVADYLLRHAERDMPSLLALLDALDRYSLASRRAITVPLLRELLNS